MLRRMVANYCLRLILVVLASSFFHAQTITSISPNPLGIGQSVTISGSNFGTSGSVTFSGVTASTTLWTSTSIIATVPPGATNNGNIVVTAGGHSSNSFSFALNNGPVNYLYDDLGRLVGVIDVNGNAAEYSYDAVGNILGISRFTSTQVSVINFSPDTSPVGTVVTINGTGFSSTPSQDTVKFNGVTATVSSATNNQIQATVPSTATTGPISVTSPNGSATSGTNFTVTSSNGAPTITSFSPTSGMAGNAVTVTGTNFDPTLANDKLRLNASQAVVSGVTSTTIATTVPAATSSGRFTLLAPAGTGVSSQDFYVPFLSHVPGDIGFTARVTPPASQPVTLGAGKIALVLFDGVEGQWVNVVQAGSTFSTCSMYLIAPNNATVVTNPCTGGNSSIPSTLLPQTGTYTVGIDPLSSSGSLTLSVSMDFTAQLILPPPGTSGSVVQVPTSGNLNVGQNAILTFGVTTPGQKVSFNVVNPTFGSSYTSCILYLYDQDRNLLNWGWCGAGASSFIDTTNPAVALPETYSVVIAPQGTAVGSVGVSLNNDADAPGAITIGNPTGTAATIATTVAGQDARLNITPAGSGQRIVVYATSVSNPLASLWLVTPSGTTQGTSVQIDNSPVGQVFFMDSQTLATGNYQLWVEHSGTNIGSETLQINSVPADVTGSLQVPLQGATGSNVQVSLVAGQNASLTFQTTTANQQLSFNVSSSTIGSSYIDCRVTVYGPSPSTTQLTYGYCGKPNGYSEFIDTVTIPNTGTYTVYIDPQGSTSGSVQVSINNDQDVTTPPISIGGPAKTPKTTVAGQDIRLSFTPSQSQRIAVTATAPTGYNPGATLNLWNGTATQASILIANSAVGQIYFLDTQPITANQTYQLWLQHSGTNYGGETLQITNVPADISHTVTVGTQYHFSTFAGQNANLRFNITSSESITLNWPDGSYPTNLNCYMRVTGPIPSTNQVGFGYCNTATGRVSLGTLSSGTYNILVDPQAQSAGGMSLTVTTP